MSILFRRLANRLRTKWIRWNPAWAVMLLGGVILAISSLVWIFPSLGLNVAGILGRGFFELQPAGVDDSAGSSTSFSESASEFRQLRLAVRKARRIMLQQASLNEEVSPVTLKSISFNIASSKVTWRTRSSIVRSWWHHGVLEGCIWLDQFQDAIRFGMDPPISFTSSWAKWKGKSGNDTRLARILVDAYRRGGEHVRWFVFGHDDTFFSPKAIAAVLAQYDYRRPLYLGSSSETHKRNVALSHNMAFGGGGYAISAVLAKALSSIMDACLLVHHRVTSSDRLVQACIAELGVPLTRILGFHQCDLQGSLRGLMMAHPQQPFLSLHRISNLTSVLPHPGHEDTLAALSRMSALIAPDPLGFAQLAVCYDSEGEAWTASVSWGVGITIHRGIRSILELNRMDSKSSFWGHTHPFDLSAVATPTDNTTNDCLPSISLYATAVEERPDGSIESFYRRYSFDTLDTSDCVPALPEVVIATVIRPAPRRLKPLQAGPNFIREACLSVAIETVHGEMRMTIQLRE